MWLLAGPVAAFALLAAHFLRMEAWWFVAASVAMILLLAVPRSWAAHLVRFMLGLAALEWLRTLGMIAAVRFSAGVPAGRMIVILSSVAILTALTLLVFRHPALRRFYRLAR